jgi:hypothetical protein
MGSEHGRSAPRHGQAARGRGGQSHRLLPPRSTHWNLVSCALSVTLSLILLVLSLPRRLAFNTNLGLAGLWIGQCGALFLVGIGQYILLLFTNWQLEVRRSEARLETEQGDDSEEETRSRSRDVAVAPYQSC